MKTFLSKQIRKQQFNPGFLGIFINPFYFVRKALYENTLALAKNITGKTLDIGCGYKPYESLFSETTEYIGIDYDSPENKKNTKIDVFYSGHKFPFNDSTFDSAVLTQVLEHIFNPDEFLSEINRVLKKNGKLLLSVPFVWDEHEQPRDYARYSSFGISHILKEHGFKIIEKRKTLNDVRVIFQLINCYIHKKIPAKNYKVRLCFYVVFITPFTLLGIIFSKILPKNDDLYMDNIILAEKI